MRIVPFWLRSSNQKSTGGEGKEDGKVRGIEKRKGVAVLLALRFFQWYFILVVLFTKLRHVITADKSEPVQTPASNAPSLFGIRR